MGGRIATWEEEVIDEEGVRERTCLSRGGTAGEEIKKIKIVESNI